MKSIKEIKAVRVLVSPYMCWKKKKDHERYQHTPDYFYLKTLKGIHDGKRCFIIGNGPSLRAADLDLLRGEYTFAANRIFNIFSQTDWRPYYYLITDKKMLKEIQNNLTKYDLGHMFLRYGSTNLDGPTNKLTKIYVGLLYNPNNPWAYDDKKYISEDVAHHFCDAFTVTFNSIQLAIYMGFKEIFLLGVDHTFSRTYDPAGKLQVDSGVKDHFDGSELAIPAAVNTNVYAFAVAREYCDTHGIKIFNATRGGKLEVFERINFDELMTNSTNQLLI